MCIAQNPQVDYATLWFYIHPNFHVLHELLNHPIEFAWYCVECDSVDFFRWALADQMYNV